MGDEDTPAEVEWMRAWIIEALQLLGANPIYQIQSTGGNVPDEVALNCDDAFVWASRVREGKRFTQEQQVAVEASHHALDALAFCDESFLVVLNGPSWHTARRVARESLAVLGMEPRQPLHLTEWPGLNTFRDD